MNFIVWHRATITRLSFPVINEGQIPSVSLYYYNKPNIIKLIELLNSEKVKILNAIGIFYTKAIDKRKYELNYISN